MFGKGEYNWENGLTLAGSIGAPVLKVGGKFLDEGGEATLKIVAKSRAPGELLKKAGIFAPAGMIKPHGHHILFEKGIGKAQQALVTEGQAILRKVGIDPINGLENLTWAPRVRGQHTLAALEPLVTDLRAVGQAGGQYDDVVEILKRYGDIAAKRKPK